MALPIRFAPTLRGKDAEYFLKKVEEGASKRKTIDFSKQRAEARAILKKANML